MIELTKPNEEIIYINPFVIESIEKTNFTMVNLTNGKRYLVVEPIEEISARVFGWWESVFKLNSRAQFIDNMTKNTKKDNE